jgi:hypothetical protein
MRVWLRKQADDRVNAMSPRTAGEGGEWGKPTLLTMAHVIGIPGLKIKEKARCDQCR